MCGTHIVETVAQLERRAVIRAHACLCAGSPVSGRAMQMSGQMAGGMLVDDTWKRFAGLKNASPRADDLLKGAGVSGTSAWVAVTMRG